MGHDDERGFRRAEERWCCWRERRTGRGLRRRWRSGRSRGGSCDIGLCDTGREGDAGSEAVIRFAGTADGDGSGRIGRGVDPGEPSVFERLRDVNRGAEGDVRPVSIVLQQDVIEAVADAEASSLFPGSGAMVR